MLLTAVVALILGQAAPVVAAAQPATAPDQQSASTQLTTAQQARLEAQRRHNGGLVCENRAPTGSVLSRRMCQRERRAQADASRARAFAGEAARGTASDPAGARQ
jgi:vancomycin resistance protein YoaR